MNANETRTARPDGILLVIAYLVTLGIGFLLGGITLLVTAVPQVYQMAREDNLFASGLAVLALLTIFCLALGLWLLSAARGLWRGRSGGRATAVVATAAITIMCLLSLPALYFSFSGGRMLVMWLGVALIVGLGSGVSLWYLLRPSVRSYYG